MDAVQARDVAALTERVDFPALRAFLTAQIVRTYLRITGKAGRPGSLPGAIREALLDFLHDGRPPNMQNAPSIGGLSSEALKNFWRVYLNSELGIGSRGGHQAPQSPLVRENDRAGHSSCTIWPAPTDAGELPPLVRQIQRHFNEAPQRF